VTNCHELKFVAADGKRYKWDAANTKTILRLIQSIPSPQAEPIKQRLATLGNERAEELNDPELGMQRSRDRAIAVYKSRGMSNDEITLRFQSIDVRHNYTDELKSRWVNSWFEYALLTNISYSRSWHDAKWYRDVKWLTKWDNLRDHMSTTELLLTSLSEEAGKKIAQSRDAQWFDQLQDALTQWAGIAKNAREQIEEQTWSSILEPINRLTAKQQILRDQAIKEKLL